MKRLIVLILLLLFSTHVVTPQGRRGRRPKLTPAVAQRLLVRSIDELSVDNALFTCRACYDFDDKADNDNFVVVTEYDNMNRYLASRGYIRRGADGRDVFTAKAKRSKYFEVFATDDGRLGGAGFRFAHFRNPRITVVQISDPKHVPIEYDLVPTDVALQFFGGVRRVQTTAAFSFEARHWSVCVGCRD